MGDAKLQAWHRAREAWLAVDFCPEPPFGRLHCAADCMREGKPEKNSARQRAIARVRRPDLIDQPFVCRIEYVSVGAIRGETLDGGQEDHDPILGKVQTG